MNPTALLNAEPLFEPMSFKEGGKNLGYSKLLSSSSCFKSPFFYGLLSFGLLLRVNVFGYSSNLTFFIDFSEGCSYSYELDSSESEGSYFLHCSSKFS